ncbi:hypothetical protein BDZ88DRAFT_415045 [Geranomyces variabilis]|nr:hypothetical protein BDZ88DRAFT_415045 [Geranomyces variabilis]KAJ3141851.1 hypothetical protein HDU90_006200 [Geranomyces variabilis]
MDGKSQEESIAELRGYWEFAAVCQFLHLFKRGLKQEEFDTEELELQLVSSPLDYRLIELHIILLRTLLGSLNARLVTTESWRTYLLREWMKHEQDSDVQLEGVEYENLSLRSRIIILHYLCEWQFDNNEKFRAAIGAEDDETEWRVAPVGTDAKGNTYWLFDDNRLYKEAPTTAPKGRSKKNARGKPTWELECVTIDDWQAFPERFKKSRSSVEKAFYEWLTEEAVPKLLSDYQAREKVKKIEEALNNRKRSSRLQMREIEKMELERQIQERQQTKQSERLRKQEENKRHQEEQQRALRLEAREQRIAEREAKLSRSQRGSPALSNPAIMPTLDEVAAAQSIKLREPRVSTRQRKKRESEDDEAWYFDCLCGVHGDNLDDGTPMIACGRCNVWQHIKCLARANGEDGDAADIEKWEKMDFTCKGCLERRDKPPVAASANGPDTTDTSDEAPFSGSADGGVAQDEPSPKRIKLDVHANGANSHFTSPQRPIPAAGNNLSGVTFTHQLPGMLMLASQSGGAPLNLPHPASPAYYQPYPSASVLPNGITDAAEHVAPVITLVSTPPITAPSPPAPSLPLPPPPPADTASAAAFLATLAQGHRTQQAGPDHDSVAFPAPVSLVPSPQQVQHSHQHDQAHIVRR